MTNIRFRYAFPDPQLFDFASVFLELDVAGDADVTDLMPPEMAALCFVFDGQWHQGPTQDAMRAMPAADILLGHTSAAYWLRGRGTGFAIGLNPLAWPAVMRGRADAHVDAVVPLPMVLGESVARQLWLDLRDAANFPDRVRVANQFLLSRAAGYPDAAARARVGALRSALADPDCVTVDELARRVGTSQRQLGRMTRACMGFTPKLLLRRARFMRMLHRADAMSYDEWPNFIEAQYVDQSHLIRDFQFFLGMAPTHYFGLDRPIVRAAFASFRDLAGWTAN